MKYSVEKKDLKKLLTSGNKSNANMAHNPEIIHKYVVDQIMEHYMMDYIPKELRDAHLHGNLHIHD